MDSQNLLLKGDIAYRIPGSQLTALLKVSASLASSLDLPIVLQTAIESTIEVLGLDTGAIYLLEGDYLHLGATTPRLDPSLRSLFIKPEAVDDHPHLKEALESQQPVYLTDAAAADLSLAEAEVRDARQLKTILYIPLVVDGRPIGALIVGTTGQVRTFTRDEVDLCRILAYQIALAVANARLFRSVQVTSSELEHAYDATLQGWALALEMRDQSTLGHTQRVTQITLRLAAEMGISEAELAHIRRGSLLHDIGKMGIPDTILKKNGPLSEEEWAIMRRHPELSYQFLVQIDFLQPALDIPYYHHERWDGRGYPRGLKGEEIPLSARIFSVADVYDALTSVRPYRPAWEKEKALQYIREQAGQQFDPEVAVKFLDKIAASL